MTEQLVRCANCNGPVIGRRPREIRRSRLHFCRKACYHTYRRQTDESTLWDRILKTDACWLWQGSTTAGYGQVKFRGQHWEVHRLVWTLLRGPIPPGAYVLHNCPGGDNKLCCNPDHLWLGTCQANAFDALAKGQMIGPPVMHGENHPKHKLTASQVIDIRSRISDSHSALAREFGVRAQTIAQIRQGLIWRGLIARDQHGLSEAQVEERSMARYGCLPSELSKRDASAFITELKR